MSSALSSHAVLPALLLDRRKKSKYQHSPVAVSAAPVKRGGRCCGRSGLRDRRIIAALSDCDCDSADGLREATADNSSDAALVALSSSGARRLADDSLTSRSRAVERAHLSPDIEPKTGMASQRSSLGYPRLPAP